MSSGLLIRFRIQEGPASVVEEAFDVVRDRLHHFGPVERLNTFRVANIARAVENKQTFSCIAITYDFASVKFHNINVDYYYSLITSVIYCFRHLPARIKKKVFFMLYIFYIL